MKGSFLASFPQVAGLPVPVVRLGLVSRIFSGGTPDKNNLTYWKGGDLPWIGSGEVNQFLIKEPTAYITAEAVASSSTKLMLKGSLVMALAGQGKTKAMVAQMGFDAYGNQSLACIADFKGSNRYLLWWLTALYREVRGLSSEDTRDGLNQSILGRLPVPRFDLETQDAIARFLDRETGRIDRLIEKEERLLALLEEKENTERAVAVTRGLQPSAQLQSTGLAWLPKAPAHWRVRRIAVLFREVNDRGDADLPVLSVSIHHGISDRELEDEERDRKVVQIEDKTFYKRVRPGDLAYNMMRAWQGAFGVATVDGLVSPAYVTARPLESIHSPYFESLLRTRNCIEEMRKASKGIADFRLRLYWEHFRQVGVVLPSLDEQVNIAKYVLERKTRFEAIRNPIIASINRLREFRSALITAGVTGQMKIAQWGNRGLVEGHIDAAGAEMRV
jgi:type I restriction enzyme S subunit